MRTTSLAILLAACAGCGLESGGEPYPRTEPEQQGAARPASQFDADSTGAIEGRVTWPGPIPAVESFVFGVPKEGGSFATELVPNPHRPAIDPESRGIAGAVVYLRGVEPARAKPWDHVPVTVEVRPKEIGVRQGDAPPRLVGFVRKGAEATLISAEPSFQILRGRGAAFFSFTVPESGRPLHRRLDEAGRVELSSGVGYYWARAHLFVAEHPYFALTDRDGRFRLERVPPGQYELSAWLANWNVARRRHDPESGLVVGLDYGPPLTATRAVGVDAGGTSTAGFTMSLSAESPK